MSLQLTLGKGNSIGTLSLLDDANQPITATFANINLTGIDGSVFTAATDGSTEVTITPVAVGTQTLSISADVSYVDVNLGQTTVNKGVTVDIAVVAAPQLQATVLSINFAPQA